MPTHCLNSISGRKMFQSREPLECAIVGKIQAWEWTDLSLSSGYTTYTFVFDMLFGITELFCLLKKYFPYGILLKIK